MKKHRDNGELNEMIGKTISHYKILEKLGEGGMGVVYRAQDTKLGRTVALKFLPPERLRDPEAKERFMQEARAASAIEHNNICAIYEVNETEDGQTFIAMAGYEGETLKEKIGRDPLKMEEALNVALQVSNGLQEAHEKGIVHRDIKPANIMVTAKGQVKTMDFGLAKLRGQIRLTKEGTTLGTVAYMSPEQARGEEVDHRTDIWSLGVVLYEMITGQLPFKSEYEQAMVYSILNEEPEPMTGLRTGIPIDLERVVGKCLQKAPDERYQTAGDLIADFHRLQGIVASPSAQQRDSKRKMLVVLPFENLGPPEDEYFADGITEEITSRLVPLKGLGVISRTSALHYKNTDKTIRQIGKELNVDYVLEGTVRWQRSGEDESRVRITPQLIRVLDDIHLWSATYDRLFQNIFSIQSEIAEQVIQRLDITLSESENSAMSGIPTDNMVAYQTYLRGLDYLKYSHAPEDQYRKAQKMFEQAIELDSNFALAHAKLSDAHRSLYFFGYDHTSERIEKAKEAVDRALELQPRLPAVHVALGYYYYQAHLDYDKALKELSIAAKSLPNDNELLANIAYVWRRQGLFEQAINNFEHALALSPNNAMLMAELAHSYLCIRKYEDAVRYCNQCIGIAPDNKWAYLIKTLCYWCWKGDILSARTALEAMPDKGSPYSIYFLFLQDIFEKNIGVRWIGFQHYLVKRLRFNLLLYQNICLLAGLTVS